MSQVQINKIIKITAGHFHCWVDSNVGIIRKPTNMIGNLSDVLEITEELKIEKIERIEEIVPKEKWWDKFIGFILRLLKIKQ